MIKHVLLSKIKYEKNFSLIELAIVTITIVESWFRWWLLGQYPIHPVCALFYSYMIIYNALKHLYTKDEIFSFIYIYIVEYCESNGAQSNVVVKS